MAELLRGLPEAERRPPAPELLRRARRIATDTNSGAANGWQQMPALQVSARR